MPMQRVSKGYTIVEVMIFLAISAALLTAAMGVISGKQAETQFNQKMRDTQSKLQDWFNDVTTGFTGGTPTQQSCKAPGNSRPTLIASPPPANYDPECIFLGKAIQFTDTTSGFSIAQSSKLYAYSVFGRRLSATTGELPTSLSDSKPIAATGQNGSGLDLTEAFDLSPAYLKKITSAPVGTSHMLGFFTTFNTEQSALQNGNSDLNAFEFNFSGSGAPGDQPSGNSVNKCLDLTSCSTSNLSNYQICLTDNHRSAVITISSTNGIGVESNLKYVATC